MKATKNKYNEAPFFFTEKSDYGKRTIAWHSDEAAQRELFLILLSGMNEWIEYLFKEDTGGEGFERWVRISGGMYKSDLLKLIKKHEKWFFTDSIFQFYCREPKVRGYFAYDENGIFIIIDKDVKVLLTDLGYSNKKVELLSYTPHFSPKGCEKQLSKFKNELKQKSVFCTDEAQPDGDTKGHVKALAASEPPRNWPSLTTSPLALGIKSMEQEEKVALVKAWIAEFESSSEPDGDQPMSKEDEIFFFSSLENPELCWELIQLVLDLTDSENVLYAMAAGPLEELLAQNGEEFIARIEVLAQKSPKLRKALDGVWQNAMSDELYKKVVVMRG